eukprot:COSAG01_NODE_21701_length_889_cov_1.796203_2_plen_246_part_01
MVTTLQPIWVTLHKAHASESMCHFLADGIADHVINQFFDGMIAEVHSLDATATDTDGSEIFELRLNIGNISNLGKYNGAQVFDLTDLLATSFSVHLDPHLPTTDDIPLSLLGEMLREGDNKPDNVNPKQEIITAGAGSFEYSQWNQFRVGMRASVTPGQILTALPALFSGSHRTRPAAQRRQDRLDLPHETPIEALGLQWDDEACPTCPSSPLHTCRRNAKLICNGHGVCGTYVPHHCSPIVVWTH